VASQAFRVDSCFSAHTIERLTLKQKPRCGVVALTLFTVQIVHEVQENVGVGAVAHFAVGGKLAERVRQSCLLRPILGD
jgi:hypothetical protein